MITIQKEEKTEKGWKYKNIFPNLKKRLSKPKLMKNNTEKQFPEIQQVRFLPEELFQP